MNLIAHRGLLYGPNKEIENHPEQIEKAMAAGYDCEIDLWLVDNSLFLGHDEPQYKIERSWLEKSELWIHAKNIQALTWLTTTDYNYFWHQSDDFVLTSKNFIWTYPGKQLTPISICVMPENNDPKLENLSTTCYGICSDYVKIIREKIQGN